ncbi:MAG: hypothetical protein AAF610_12915 [Pseudomonadota bacterium]
MPDNNSRRPEGPGSGSVDPGASGTENDDSPGDQPIPAGLLVAAAAAAFVGGLAGGFIGSGGLDGSDNNPPGEEQIQQDDKGK